MKKKSLFSKKTERNIVSRIAKGSISLQQGYYQTTEDIKQRKEKLLNYKFVQ